MVGAYLDSSFGARYFVLIDGEFKDVGPLDTSPFAPPLVSRNVDGNKLARRVVGNYADGSGSHGFLLRNGIYTNIDAPWVDPLNLGTTAAGINPEGDIVGFYTTSSGIVQGFLLTQGSYVDMPTAVFGAQWSAINPAGNILGEYFDSGGNIYGFLLKKGVLTDVVGSGAGQVVPLGMNAQGDIVGTTFYSTPSCGFLLSHGAVMTVDSLLPNSPCTFPYGINEQGDIVGTYFDNVGSGMHGFLLKKNAE